MIKKISSCIGTLWCGAGNKAKSCEELGEHSETDKCCREHDLCPYSYRSFEEYNGHFSDLFYSMSHCQCDQIFHNCLHEKPYKQDSSLIWEYFSSINVKCFAYFPCDDSNSNEIVDSYYEKFYSNIGDRRLGSCFNKSRVVVFDSIDDYTDYINKNLQIKHLNHIQNQLSENYEWFLNKNKKNWTCFKQLGTQLPSKIVKNFEEEFLSTNRLKTLAINDAKNESYDKERYFGHESKLEFDNRYFLPSTFLIVFIFSVFFCILCIKLCKRSYTQIRQDDIIKNKEKRYHNIRLSDITISD
jgi:secretory phospholipase A2